MIYCFFFLLSRLCSHGINTSTKVSVWRKDRTDSLNSCISEERCHLVVNYCVFASGHARTRLTKASILCIVTSNNSEVSCRGRMKSVLPRLAEFGAEGDDGDWRSHPHKRHCNRVGSRPIKLRGVGLVSSGYRVGAYMQ